MTALLQVYQCGVCGNMVEVIHGSTGTLTCCNQAMNLMSENTTDAAIEKHVPVITKTADGYKVTVGSVLHPMLDEHYIEWIELTANGIAYRKFLKPGDAPEADFSVSAENVSAREFCNLHGVWKGE